MSDRAIAAALSGVPAGETLVEVTGDGALARGLRERLRAREVSGGGARPAIVVETTGEQDSIRTALERVDDLGTVVLAGPVPPPPFTLDVYADLHVRGLTLIAVAPQPDSGAAAP